MTSIRRPESSFNPEWQERLHKFRADFVRTIDQDAQELEQRRGFIQVMRPGYGGLCGVTVAFEGSPARNVVQAWLSGDGRCLAIHYRYNNFRVGSRRFERADALIVDLLVDLGEIDR